MKLISPQTWRPLFLLEKSLILHSWAISFEQTSSRFRMRLSIVSSYEQKSTLFERIALPCIFHAQITQKPYFFIPPLHHVHLKMHPNTPTLMPKATHLHHQNSSFFSNNITTITTTLSPSIQHNHTLIRKNIHNILTKHKNPNHQKQIFKSFPKTHHHNFNNTH